MSIHIISLHILIHDFTFSSKIIIGKTCGVLNVNLVILGTNWKIGKALLSVSGTSVDYMGRNIQYSLQNGSQMIKENIKGKENEKT